eukprot:5016747-Amphidinium_carterae.1
MSQIVGFPCKGGMQGTDRGHTYHVCTVHGTRHRVQNEPQLLEMTADHYDQQEPEHRHAPIDWMTPAGHDQWDITYYDGLLKFWRDALLDRWPRLGYWRQFAHTPHERHRGGDPRPQGEVLRIPYYLLGNALLFSAHLLLIANNNLYEHALSITAGAIIHITQRAVSIRLRGDFLDFIAMYHVAQHGVVATWFVPFDRRARVIIIDIIVRTRASGVYAVTHCRLAGPPADAFFVYPPLPVHTFSTSWMSHVTGKVAIIVDMVDGDVFFMYAQRRH